MAKASLCTKAPGTALERKKCVSRDERVCASLLFAKKGGVRELLHEPKRQAGPGLRRSSGEREMKSPGQSVTRESNKPQTEEVRENRAND